MTTSKASVLTAGIAIGLGACTLAGSVVTLVMYLFGLEGLVAKTALDGFLSAAVLAYLSMQPWVRTLGEAPEGSVPSPEETSRLIRARRSIFLKDFNGIQVGMLAFALHLRYFAIWVHLTWLEVVRLASIHTRSIDFSPPRGPFHTLKLFRLHPARLQQCWRPPTGHQLTTRRSLGDLWFFPEKVCPPPPLSLGRPLLIVFQLLARVYLFWLWIVTRAGPDDSPHGGACADQHGSD